MRWLLVLGLFAAPLDIADPDPATLTVPGDGLAVHADPACPLSTADALAISARALATADLKPAAARLDIALELQCYQLQSLTKPSYALLVSLRPRGVAGSSNDYRRMGVLPAEAATRPTFLQHQLEKALKAIVSQHGANPE